MRLTISSEVAAVVVLVCLAPLDVAGPGDDIHLSFTLAQLFQGFGGLQAAAGEDGGDHCAQQGGFAH
jgi:hypothetical protein